MEDFFTNLWEIKKCQRWHKNKFDKDERGFKIDIIFMTLFVDVPQGFLKDSNFLSNSYRKLWSQNFLKKFVTLSRFSKKRNSEEIFEEMPKGSRHFWIHIMRNFWRKLWTSFWQNNSWRNFWSNQNNIFKRDFCEIFRGIAEGIPKVNFRLNSCISVSKDPLGNSWRIFGGIQ